MSDRGTLYGLFSRPGWRDLRLRVSRDTIEIEHPSDNTVVRFEFDDRGQLMRVRSGRMLVAN